MTAAPSLPTELLALGDFAFIDVETTGTRPLEDRITEVAIIRFHQGGAVTRWQSLVNPGVPIPAEIQALTGISNEMVRHAPDFFDLREAIRALLEGAVFVAHNARFDYGFIKNEFRRQRESFTADVLCTVRLSRRLYPAASGHGLDALIARHCLTDSHRHRAMGDTEAVAAFVQHAAQDLGAPAVAAAARALLRTPSLPAHLPDDALRDIPDSPGVYLFYGVNDLPLYVGKARHLRERIRAHFSSDHMTANDVRLSQELRRIECMPTAGEFSALLLEAQLVKSRMPLHNIALRRREKQGFYRLPHDDAGSAATSTALHWVPANPQEPTPDGERYGPFSDRAAAKKWLMVAAREHRLCDHRLGFSRPRAVGEPCFARQVGRCHGVCEGAEAEAVYLDRLRAALAPMRFPDWPYPGAIVLEECDPGNDRVDLLCFDQWCAVSGGVRLPFDGDVFRLLRRTLDRASLSVRPLTPATPA